MNKIYIFFLFFLVLIITRQHTAKEILIYADSISYDSQNNIIGKGNVKIIDENEILMSDLVIIDNKTKKMTLPINFSYKDNKNNYYFGTSGEFSSNFENGIINDVKMLLNDGSRIVGIKGFKTGKIDMINKGVYSPCTSRINIKNFICPIWQIEAEKILHDREQLFLYQKHAKMRLFNVPVYYLPYVVSPSPLRKKRKSGFLNPNISTNFIDAQTSQTFSFPYYFAIDEDKELLLTPTINYGGGVDSSQRILANYQQVISGGGFSVYFQSDTNFENQNNESWLRDFSLITGLNKNINEKYKLSLTSAFQSSPTYLRRSDQNNFLNRKNALSTSVALDGYNLRKFDDHLHSNITGYQVVRNAEDNKTYPTTFPYIMYSDGTYSKGKIKYSQKVSFYNIFRDNGTDVHAQQQQKIYHNLSTDYEFYRLNSKLNLKTELLSQFYNITNKKIAGEDYTGTYGRIFPMTGLYIQSPIVNRKNNLNIIPTISFIVNGSQSSSDKVSNEESTNNSYSLLTVSELDRFVGTDKLDNSKRVNYGVQLNTDRLKSSLSQSYEFDADSNYIKEVGLKDYMSDLLGSLSYSGSKIGNIAHKFRFNVDVGMIQNQEFTYGKGSKLGSFNLKYFQERNENFEIGNETLNLSFNSNKFFNYSDIYLNSTFDLIKDDPTQYSAGYSYFDECFGINLSFGRSFYSDRDLKPSDVLTLMFSFKHLGSYSSTNLAVDHRQRQGIRWNSSSIDNAKFKVIDGP